MDTKGRALFNLIRMNWLEDPSLPIDGWEVDTYRQVSTDELFQKLKHFEIDLDQQHFLGYAESCLTPEELAEMLWVGAEDALEFDKAYLLIFELWRRLLPEKQSLSIFCDQLDYLIEQYDQEKLDDETLLQDFLTGLERILDENVDQGADPQKIFAEISRYCAHDLSSFIYDYAAEQLDYGNGLYASELVDAFSEYVADVKWFEFLRIRLIADTEPEEAQILLENLLDSLKKNPDFELLLEIAKSLVHRGVASLFLRTVKQARKVMETEQDFQELLAITCEFFRLLDQEEVHRELLFVLKSRQGADLDARADEGAIDQFYKLLKDFQGSEV